MVAYVGFFSDVGKAKAIQQTLKSKKYTDKEVFLIEPASGEDLKKALSYAKNRDFISKAMAARALPGLEQGKAFLMVKARIGDGTMIEGLLADGGEKVSTSSDSTSQFFFSDIIGLPMVTSTRSSASGPPEATRPLTDAIAPCIIQRRGSRASSMGVPLTSKGLVTGGFMPLLAKPLMTGGLMPLLSKRKTKE